jgi:predicted DNA-binding antitoxin AbrB/MazE fold protein
VSLIAKRSEPPTLGLVSIADTPRIGYAYWGLDFGGWRGGTIMAITVEATYENGVLKPKRPLRLAEGSQVQVTIRAMGQPRHPLDEVIGICDEGPETSLAERHDEIIYGLKEQDTKAP